MAVHSNKMIIVSRHYIAALAAVFLLQGCLRDNTDGCVTDNGKTVVIELKMPELTSTRSESIVTPAMDYAVGHLDVLVFEDRGGDNDLFMYASAPTGEVAHPNNPATRTFSLPLKKSPNGERQKLVVLANLEDEVRELLRTWVPDPEQATITKKELLAKLFFDHPGDWGSEYGGLPMWGESSKSVIVIQTTLGGSFGDIGMLYSVGKVEVAVNANSNYTEAYGLGNFKMISSTVWNSRTKGYAVPQEESQYAGGKVQKPCIPAGCGISQQSLGITTRLGDSDFPLLYMPPCHILEADNRNSSNEDCVFVVVGGYYSKTGSTNESDITYYRIDLYDRTSETPAQSRLDILRGHRYMINITGVDGPGYATPEEAADSQVTAMTVEVIAWGIDNRDIYFDGTQYYLNVSENNMTIGRDARTNLKLSVKTDVPAGYGIEITDSADQEGNPLDWMRLLADNAGALVFGVDNNFTAGSRTAYIHVTAGRLSNVVTVTQLNVQVLTLDVNVEPDYEMVFINNRGNMDASFGAAQTLSIAWDPVHLPINITKVETLDGGVVLPSSVDGSYPGVDGQVDISIRPNSMSASDIASDVWREKVSRLDIELAGDEGARVIKSVFVRQRSYGVKQNTNPDRYYSMIYNPSGIDPTGNVNIAVNTPWTSAITGSAVASVSPSSAAANTAGQTLTFTMAKASAGSTAVINSKMVIKSTPGWFPDYEININGVWGWVFDATSSTSYHDATGIYVAREWDGNGTTGSSNSPIRWADTNCPSGWSVPAINTLRSVWSYWGRTSQLRAQANFVNGGNYWSATDEVAPFSKVGKTFSDSGPDLTLARQNNTNHWRCVRRITTDYPNAQ